MNESDIDKLTQSVLKFRNQRNWNQFHLPKDMALSLVLEATELLEHFQWKNGEELEEYIKNNKSEIAHELMDVLYWVLLMSHDLNIDIEKTFEAKMKLNRKKYPVSKAKNKHFKYTNYQNNN